VVSLAVTEQLMNTAKKFGALSLFRFLSLQMIPMQESEALLIWLILGLKLLKKVNDYHGVFIDRLYPLLKIKSV
jgi:hypothetical protein